MMRTADRYQSHWGHFVHLRWRLKGKEACLVHSSCTAMTSFEPWECIVERNERKSTSSLQLNPIAYGRGGGGFLSHTTIVLAATLKPLKLWLPNFVTSCFYLFATIWETFSKIDLPGGCYSHFSNERSRKIRDMKIFVSVKNGWDT